MPLDIEITRVEAGTYKVKLAGALDTETSEQLDRRIQEVWSDVRARAIRLDLHELKFISSLGLGSIAKIKKAAATRGGAVVIVGAQPQIARVFEIAKMMPKETVFTTREEADAYLRAIQKSVIDEQRQAPGS